MYRTKINRIIQLLALIAFVMLGLQSAQAFDNTNGPELPGAVWQHRGSRRKQASLSRLCEGVQIRAHTTAK